MGYLSSSNCPALAAAAIIATASGCKEEPQEEGGDLIAQKVLGPSGGQIQGGGVTLSVPPRALTADTEFELRTSSDDLSAGGFRQSGSAVSIQPAGLILKLPGTLSFADGPGAPAVLFRQDGLTVAALGREAFINEIGAVAISLAGTVTSSVLEPSLSDDPMNAGEPHRDASSFRIGIADAGKLNLAMTIYDVEDAYEKPLNGSGEGECGFRLEDVVGGSLASGCVEGPLTASISVTGAEVEFSLVPHLAGKMETPVSVGLVAGSDEIAFQLGFFAFDTGSCFEETCSGAGVCEPLETGARCVCDDGFAPAPPPDLECVCVPQCDGRLCGPNGCDGECEPGCPVGEICHDLTGECMPGPATDTGASESTGSSDSTGTTGTTSGGTT